MRWNKNQLSYWGMIAGLIFLPLFILANVFTFLHTMWWLIAAGAWVMGIIIGVLIIVNWLSANKRDKDLLYLIGGIFLILFPFIGGLLLLIDRLAN